MSVGLTLRVVALKNVRLEDGLQTQPQQSACNQHKTNNSYRNRGFLWAGVRTHFIVSHPVVIVTVTTYDLETLVNDPSSTDPERASKRQGWVNELTFVAKLSTTDLIELTIERLG